MHLKLTASMEILCNINHKFALEFPKQGQKQPSSNSVVFIVLGLGLDPWRKGVLDSTPLSISHYSCRRERTRHFSLVEFDDTHSASLNYIPDKNVLGVRLSFQSTSGMAWLLLIVAVPSIKDQNP
jgi:hypothetical protein